MQNNNKLETSFFLKHYIQHKKEKGEKKKWINIKIK